MTEYLWFIVIYLIVLSVITWCSITTINAEMEDLKSTLGEQDSDIRSRVAWTSYDEIIGALKQRLNLLETLAAKKLAKRSVKKCKEKKGCRS